VGDKTEGEEQIGQEKGAGGSRVTLQRAVVAGGVGGKAWRLEVWREAAEAKERGLDVGGKIYSLFGMRLKVVPGVGMGGGVVGGLMRSLGRGVEEVEGLRGVPPFPFHFFSLLPRLFLLQLHHILQYPEPLPHHLLRSAIVLPTQYRRCQSLQRLLELFP
jgi:hypothetical protein